jgi:uncharacterized protein with von Willebrand factor type A (vWA) domain
MNLSWLEFLPFLIPMLGILATVGTKRWMDVRYDRLLEAEALLEIEKRRTFEFLAEQRRREIEEQARRTKALPGVVDELVSRVRFLEKRVQIGRIQTGERAIGMVVEESMTPADDIDIRAIGSFSEVGSLLSNELVFGADLLNQRILTGEAMVRTNLEHVTIHEPIYEPVWETRKQVLYVLLDVSGSMYDQGGQWKVPIWKAILHGLLNRAVAQEAIYLQREFHDKVTDLFRADSAASVGWMRNRIEDPLRGSGTKIEQALFVGISDLVAETYDKADIVIVTDGEDKEIDIAKVRAALAENKIGLHAILIGVENKTLRACSTIAQNVDHKLNLGELTTNPLG